MASCRSTISSGLVLRASGDGRVPRLEGLKEAAPAPGGGLRLRVVSFNIHKGLGPTNIRVTLERIRMAIRSHRADIVFLQEVVGQHDRLARKFGSAWPVAGQLEALADSEWHHFAYGRNAVYPDGHHGNAILSRYPIAHWENHDISQHASERRGILACSVNLPSSQVMHCYCVHFGLFEQWRQRQTIALCDIVQARSGADEVVLIAGDFNDWRRRVSHAIKDRLRVMDAADHIAPKRRATYPAMLPYFELDRIYYRGAQLLEARILRGAVWRGLSDHAPVAAELQLNAE